MSDLVRQLRKEGSDAMRKHLSMGMWSLCEQAADEIDRLRARAEAAEAALTRALDRAPKDASVLGEPMMAAVAHASRVKSLEAERDEALSELDRRAVLRDEAMIRAGINILLEKIAEKFEGWPTYDVWRSDAAMVVRGFKHQANAEQDKP